MSEIHKALAIFGLDPGSSQDAIQRRYKRLIMVWHPDRFPTDDGKKDAEEELKKINNANDVLKKHFASGHRASGCECQKPAAGAEQRTHGPGPGPHRKADDAEAEAKRRDEERRKKAAAEEAARKAAEQQQQQQKKATETTFQQAQRQQDELKWNKIRWQIAAGEVALFIGLCIFGNVGYGLKEWWHDFSWKWERDHAPHEETKPNPVPSYVPDVTPNPNPFGPIGPPPHNNPNMLPNGVVKPFDNSHVPVPNYPPSTSTGTTTDTIPGFNWKPVTPGTTIPSPYEQVAPKIQPNTDTSTTTNTGTGVDFDKYINH
jgi:hypothetical protein